LRGFIQDLTEKLFDGFGLLPYNLPLVMVECGFIKPAGHEKAPIAV